MSAVAARLPRAICRAMHGARTLNSSHASTAWCSDLQDGTCLGKRNSVRNARQVQGAGRRWGVLRFPRSVSNGAARVTMRQLGVVTCMAPALAKCNGVRSARQVQQAVDRRWGVNSGSRDPRQHGARAARVSAAGTCSCSARASDLCSIVKIFNRRAFEKPTACDTFDTSGFWCTQIRERPQFETRSARKARPTARTA